MLKNIIVTAVNLIFIMTRDFERTLTKHTKNTFDILFFKEVDEENIKELLNVEKNNLLYNIVIQ